MKRERMNRVENIALLSIGESGPAAAAAEEQQSKTQNIDGVHRIKNEEEGRGRERRRGSTRKDIDFRSIPSAAAESTTRQLNLVGR